MQGNRRLENVFDKKGICRQVTKRSKRTRKGKCKWKKIKEDAEESEKLLIVIEIRRPLSAGETLFSTFLHTK